MTSGVRPKAEIWREARASGRMITWTVLRVVVSIAVVTVLYYLLPFDRSATGVAVTLLVAGLVMIADLITLGLAIKVIVGAVRRGRQRQPQAARGARFR